MSLTWPWGLAALLAVPLLLLVRWWMIRRRRRVAVRVSSVALIRAALPGRSLWRRRIPVLLFVTGLLALGAGIARPQASVAVPSNSTSILLALDVSRSMCATDVPPNRLTAAREAARQFVLAQDEGTRVGLVAFSGVAGLVAEPTTDRDALLAEIDTLTTARGTAIGLAILTAIDAIAETNPDVPPSGVDLGAGPSNAGPSGAGPSGAEDAIAEYEADTIVVLTDGANTQGVDPVTAAEQAVPRNLRIYTIGFGTTEPAQMVCTADQVGDNATIPGDGPGWGGFRGGGRRYLEIDEPTLTEVAEMTGGRYFRAQDSEQLIDVMTDLPTQIEVQREDMELTVWFVLAGALLVLVAVGLSLWWNRSPGVPTTPARVGGTPAAA